MASPYVLIKGGATHRPFYQKLQDLSLDQLHRRRLHLSQVLKEGILTTDAMNQRDCKDKDDEDKRVSDYIKWKETKTGTGYTNEQNMRMWSDLNIELKRRGIEGRLHSIDDLRRPRKVLYD